MRNQNGSPRIDPLGRLFFRTLLIRLLLPGVVLAILGAAAWGVVAVQDARARQRRDAEAAAQYVRAFLDSGERLLDLTAAHIASEGNPDRPGGGGSKGGTTPPGAAHPVAELRMLLRTSEAFHRVLLLDGSRRVLASAPEAAAQTDFSGLLLWTPTHGVRALTVPYYSPVAEQIVIGLARRVSPKEILLAELDLDAMQEYAATIQEGRRTGTAVITDHYGNVLAHPDSTLVQEQQNLGHLDIIGAMQDRSSNSRIERVDGRRVLLSATREATSGWFVMLGLEVQEILLPLAGRALATIGAVLFLLLLGTYLLNRAARRSIVAPLREFTAGANALAAGSRDIPAAGGPGAGFRELRELAKAFRDMAQAVRNREDQLRASQERWQFALEGAGHGVWDWQLEEGTLFFSQGFLDMVGLSRREIGASGEDWLGRIHPEDAVQVRPEVERALRGEVSMFTSEYRFLTGDERYIWVLARGKVVERDAEGEPVRMIGTHTDITERREREETIRRIATERESMLKEIHHRVKNNLNVAASLLSLQAEHVKSAEDAQNAFRQSRDRIYSMARVHEELYKGDNLSAVDMKAYIEGISRELLSAYGREGTVSLETSIEAVTLDIETAVPCGIILNELVSNALRHAFPDGAAGVLRVDFTGRSGECFELAVSDNGIGLSSDHEAAMRRSLGLQLIHALAGQINASVKVETDGGTTFRIRSASC